MPDNNSQKNIQLRISRIKDISFSINQGVALPPEEDVNINLAQQLNFNLEKNEVELIITAAFSKKTGGEVLTQITVSNIFQVQELKQFQVQEQVQSKSNDDKIAMDIPDHLYITMLSLSISHTRALLAKNLAGSAFEPVTIPILDPVAIAKAFSSGGQEQLKS